MNIVVVDNYSDVSYNRNWDDIAMDLHHLEDVQVAGVLKAPRARNLNFNIHPDTYFINKMQNKATLTKRIAEYLHASRGQKGLLIWPDARDSLVIDVAHHIKYTGIDVKMMGFWIDSAAYTFSDVRRRLPKDHNWSMKFERTLMECFDYNLLPFKSYLNGFKRINKEKRPSVQYCPLPYTRLIERNLKELSQFNLPRENIIIMNTTPDSNYDEKIYIALRKEFPEYEFIQLHEHTFSPEAKRRLFARSKIIFSSNRSDSDPFRVFEAMTLGCMPIIPDIPIYETIFPERYLYSSKLLLKPPYINFIRNRHMITDKFKSIMNSSKVDPYLEIDVLRIHEKFYSSKKFKNLICSMF